MKHFNKLSFVVLILGVLGCLVAIGIPYLVSTQTVNSKLISIDRLKDRRGHVGHSTVTKINLYEQYVDTLRDDMEAAKADIAALGDRFQVILSKIDQLETALDAEKRRVNERMQSIERDRQQLIKQYGGCR